MRNYLAIDAGGTSTRAVFFAADGQCHGYGVSGGGNPVSRGIEGAASALVQASLAALGGTDKSFASATVCMAGASLEIPTHLFHQRFVPLGLTGSLMIESDLLGAFYSGTRHDKGYALIAGTGAVAARISSAKLAAVADGTGWLLGDNGSGFWLGREVLRAVSAALDGRGSFTALTDMVLADLDIQWDRGSRRQGRVGAQQQLIAKAYALDPIELSRFAPLAFAAGNDETARDILDRAAALLAQTLGAVMEPELSGPLVFGGSVLTKGHAMTAAVVAALQQETQATVMEPVTVGDGVAGAAVLALKRAGEVVDAEVFAAIFASLATLRG